MLRRLYAQARSRWRSSYLVTERNHPVLVGFDLGQMEGDVTIELVKERDPVANQDRQDRIAYFVGQSATKALSGNGAPAGKPDAAEGGVQTPIHELSQI